MTLKEFRKLLQGCKADAEVAILVEGSPGVVYADIEIGSVTEQNIVDTEGGERPYIFIHLRRVNHDR